MDEIGELVGGTGKLVGSLMGAVLTVAYLMRKFLLSDKVQSATAQGNVDVIEALKELADRAEKREGMAVERATLAESRTDTAYKERNDAFHEISALREQVKYLTETAEQLRKQLDAANQRR